MSANAVYRKNTGITKAEKEAWIAALRSGEYKQGHGVLKHCNGNECEYCCLGLLTQIIDPDNLSPGQRQPSIYYYQYAEGLGCHSPYLPFIFSDNDPDASDLEGVLARLNDDGKTFPEIADWIEENVPTTD